MDYCLSVAGKSHYWILNTGIPNGYSHFLQSGFQPNQQTDSKGFIGN